MIASTKTAPPNSLVLIMDSHGGEIPESMRGALISHTDSCIAVGCLSEDDGTTEFVLGVDNEVNSEGGATAFEGLITTPSRKLVVRTVLGENLLEQVVPKRRTKVRIWVNDLSEPDRVIVGVSAES